MYSALLACNCDDRPKRYFVRVDLMCLDYVQNIPGNSLPSGKFVFEFSCPDAVTQLYTFLATELTQTEVECTCSVHAVYDCT